MSHPNDALPILVDEGPVCDITGELESECDCGECYFKRYQEPKPCGWCGGVGQHERDC